jgi:hypothetical protein
MMDRQLPPWLLHLEDEDHQFIKRLILASGSLKELAKAYGVSYPTIRVRLDRLIERVRTLDDLPASDAFLAKLRLLVASGELSAKTAAELLRLRNESAAGGSGGGRNVVDAPDVEGRSGDVRGGKGREGDERDEYVVLRTNRSRV